MELKVNLFYNKEKRSEKGPDYSGSFEHNGMKHQIAAWKRDAYKDKKAYIYVKVNLGYKVEPNGKEIFESIFSIDRVNKRSDKAPDYSQAIKIGKVDHEVALWDNGEKGMSFRLNPKDTSKKKNDGPFKETAEKNDQYTDAEEVVEPLDDLPF